jgi:hypothetical protein
MMKNRPDPFSFQILWILFGMAIGSSFVFMMSLEAAVPTKKSATAPTSTESSQVTESLKVAEEKNLEGDLSQEVREVKVDKIAPVSFEKDVERLSEISRSDARYKESRIKAQKAAPKQLRK